MLGIDADAEKLRVGESRGILLQLLQHLREIVAHSRAIIGKRAARVDKRQQQRLAAELLQVNALAVLIDQRDIRNFFARLRDVQLRSAIPRGPGALGEADVLQFGVIAEHECA